MELFSLEMLGFVAGATNLMSSVPQLAANLRNPALASGQSLWRNCLQCAGNALWMIYGLSVGSVSMTTFAALGCLMAGGLMAQILRTEHHGSGAKPRARDPEAAALAV